MIDIIFDELVRLDRETPKTILFIGDGMQDIYIHGRLESSQDDCPKFVSNTTVTVPGGALNAYTSVAKWNAERFCQAEQETTKTRFVVNGKVVWRYDRDFPAERPFKNMAYIESLNPDAILISDYDKGFLSKEVIRLIISYASERKIPCVVDAKREPELYRGAIIKGNGTYFDKFGHSMGQLPACVITHGGNVPVVRNGHGWIKSSSSCKKVNCINHVGAGDCFAAHLTLALAHGFSLEDSATIAHSAGRVYVQHMHNRPPWYSPHSRSHPIPNRSCRHDVTRVFGRSVKAQNVSYRLTSISRSYEISEWSRCGHEFRTKPSNVLGRSDCMSMIQLGRCLRRWRRTDVNWVWSLNPTRILGACVLGHVLDSWLVSLLSKNSLLYCHATPTNSHVNSIVL